MEPQVISPPQDLAKCCDCGCSCSLISDSSCNWLRSVKRKYDEYEEGNQFHVPGIELYSNAKVLIESEVNALRETVSHQQQSLQELYAELEEERNSSSTAANEAMSMILRLQREKAEIQMEARQFKRFAEEKMAHDQEEVFALEDVLYKREQAIQSLTCEMQAYKHRMMSYGLTEGEAEGDREGYCFSPTMGEIMDTHFDVPTLNYPPLRCTLNENPGDDVEDVDKFAFGEVPNGEENLRNLECRIFEMESSSDNSRLNQYDGDTSGTKISIEKIIGCQSPGSSMHPKNYSADSVYSPAAMGRKIGADVITDSPARNTNTKKMEYVPSVEDNIGTNKMANASDIEDGMSDRIYTIDSIHNVAPDNGNIEPKGGVTTDVSHIASPGDRSPDVSDSDIMKLYMRLQALEADRESMRQAIVSMRTDKAQVALLKEIAQQLCKEVSPERRRPACKPSSVGAFSFLSFFKWVTSFVFWRTKARCSKYLYVMSPSNAGLLMLLDKGPRLRQWRCLTSTQV